MANFYLDELKYSLENKTTELRMTCYRISNLATAYDKSKEAEVALKYLCLKAESLAHRISEDREVIEDLENPLNVVQKLVRTLRALANYLSGR
jgi:predicted RNase H-like nuclease (RuvC/YqgF family)